MKPDRLAEQHAADAARRQEQRAAFRAWLAGREDFCFAVTLVYGRSPPTRARARSDLCRWDARVNRRLLGPRWQKHPDERMLSIWFAEGHPDNGHWHGLVNVDRPLEEFQAHADAEWRRIAPGNAAVRPVVDPAGREAASWYLTKALDATKLEDDVEMFGITVRL